MEPAGSLGRTLCVAAQAFDAKCKAGVVPGEVPASLGLNFKDIFEEAGAKRGASRTVYRILYE
jgi:hypothetical protein